MQCARMYDKCLIKYASVNHAMLTSGVVNTKLVIKYQSAIDSIELCVIRGIYILLWANLYIDGHRFIQAGI